MLPLYRGKGCQGVGDQFVVGHLGLFHAVSLQGQRGSDAPRCASSEIDHQGDHLIGIDGRIVPCHAVTRSAQEATDHAFHHATLELIPGGLIIAAVGHTCLGGVVEKLIVANPEGSVPGLVICVTVHRSGRLVDVISLQGQRGDLCPPCATRSVVHPHGSFEVAVCLQIVVCIRTLASEATIHSEAEDSGSDRRPLRLSQGHRHLIQGEDVGSSHLVWLVDVISLQGQQRP